MSPHLWIVAELFTVDFALHRWFGDKPDIPYGVFRKTDYPHLRYDGEEIQLGVSQTLYISLSQPVYFPIAEKDKR